MPIDPYLHAQMTNLVMREKELLQEEEKLKEDIPLWSKRVKLATDKGMHDLARQAQEKLDELTAREGSLRTELDTIGMEKDMIRKQSRMPSGNEVARAEAMLEQVRQGGLVDPDRASFEQEMRDLEAEVAFDFSKDKE